MLSQFRRGALSSVHGLLQCNDLIVTENKPQTPKAKNIFDYKLEHFMACILLLINRTDTFRCGLLLIFLEFRLKQVYDIHSKGVTLDLDLNQERDLSKGRIQIHKKLYTSFMQEEL